MRRKEAFRRFASCCCGRESRATRRKAPNTCNDRNARKIGNASPNSLRRVNNLHTNHTNPMDLTSGGQRETMSWRGRQEQVGDSAWGDEKAKFAKRTQ